MQDPELYRAILESLPAGVCVVDQEKIIQLWSDGAERITGRRRHEVIGRSCVGEPLLHCARKDCEGCREECPMVRTMKTSQPAETVAFVYHRAGYEIPVRARAVPVRNAHGSIIGAVEIFDDQQPAAGPNHRGQNLHQLGYVDDVTSVANRIMMQAHLRDVLGTFHEVHVPFCLLCLRLNNLRDFRARFGADAAASLLRMVARTIESAVWVTDFVGRWTEEEFLVILNGCREDKLASVRQRLQRLVATDAIEWWGERLSLPFSIGQVASEPGDTLELLLERLRKSVRAASSEAGAGEHGT